MSGRGKRFNRGGRGGGQHRPGVKTTNFGNRINIRRKVADDDDVSMNAQPASHKILISGYSHGANTEVIRTMLLGRVDGLKFLEFSVQDAKVMASVGTKAEANALQNLSGLLFGNKKLMIKHLERNLPYNNSKSKFAGKNERPTNIRQERAAIEQFVKRHYDADDRILNLSNLANHLPNLNSVDFNNKSFMLQLFDLLGQCCPDILTIVLARNNISKLEAFSSLTKYRVKIMNISLDSNKISDFEQLNALRDLNLRELVLTGNPVGNGLDEIGYQLEVVRRLPDLAYLDTRKIKQGEDNHPVTQLPPIQGNFFDAPNRQTLADGFLQKYYEAYDGDRDSLTHAYAEQSCFSISLAGASKPVGRGGSTFRGDKFIPYAPLDRNMTNNKSLDTRTTTLKTGPTHIVGTLLDLPQTKHDYDSFIVDCFVCSMGPFEMLNIFVHGSFTESTKAKRSFSRVFLLAPPPPGSKPDGWPVVIINDQFYIRYFTPKRVKAPQPELPPPTAAATTTTTTTTTTATGNNNNNNNSNNQEEMKTLVLRLSSITRLTPQFAEQCLSQNMWSYEHALANFQDLRAKNIITSEMLMP